MKKIIEAYAKKPKGRGKLNILHGVYNFWRKFTDIIQTLDISKLQDNNLTQLFKFSRALDNIIIYTLMC
jgi:hypothetical protein